MSNAEQFRKRLEILYGEALDAKKADASQVRGRANALIESYNDLRRELKESIAPDLNIPELGQVSTRFEDFNAITVAQTRIGQIISHVTNAMIALGCSPSQQKASSPLGSAAPTIQVNVIQQVNQLTAIKFEQLIDMIQQQQGISNEVRVAATNAVKDFDNEIAQPKPQPSKLKACLNIVLKAGTQFGIPLLFKILENWNKIFH